LSPSESVSVTYWGQAFVAGGDGGVCRSAWLVAHSVPDGCHGQARQVPRKDSDVLAGGHGEVCAGRCCPQRSRRLIAELPGRRAPKARRGGTWRKVPVGSSFGESPVLEGPPFLVASGFYVVARVDRPGGGRRPNRGAGS